MINEATVNVNLEEISSGVASIDQPVDKTPEKIDSEN